MYKPKTLITGVNGFVGTKLAKKLLALGHEVIGVDIIPSKELEGLENYNFQEVDLTNWKSVDQLNLSELDHVVHLAAAGVKAAGRHWPICVRVNVEGTANLVKKLLSEVENSKALTVEGKEGSHQSIKPSPPELELQTRTCSAPSPNSQLPASRAKRAVPLFLYTKTWYEDHLDECEAFAESPYVVTKAAATRWVEALATTYSGPVVIAKVFQVYGPGDDPNNVLSYAARCLMEGETAVFGSGTQLRDWIHIEDFVDGLVACLKCDKVGLNSCDLGTGELRTLRGMVECMATLLEKEPDKAKLVFDSDRDRGDGHIHDRALILPEGWLPVHTHVSGLQSFLSDGCSL